MLGCLKHGNMVKSLSKESNNETTTERHLGGPIR